MLQYLKIKNLALLEEATVEFGSGFTVVTGETGAGKSVLMGALSIVAGARVDKALIRQGATQCEVEASLYFQDLSSIGLLLENLGIPACEEGLLLIKRTIYREKPQRIFVNGSAVTLANLMKIGELWIDFHGPGEPQKLTNNQYQLSLMDAFGGQDLEKMLAEYRTAYVEWKEAIKDMQALQKEGRWTEEECVFWAGQLEKMESIPVSKAVIEALENDFSRIANMENLAMHCGRIYSKMEDQGVLEYLRDCIREAQLVTKMDEPFGKPLLERLQSVLIECEDIGLSYQNFIEKIDTDPEKIQSIQEKMRLWLEIRRQYGPNIEQVLVKMDEIGKKLSMQGDIEAILMQKSEKISKIEQYLWSMARSLTHRRQQEAKRLSQSVMDVLKRLGFKKANIEILISLSDTLGESGANNCEILFSPNSGQALMPLAAIASSGEMARVMLAFKTILADADDTALLVFDEVDANVGGEIGAEVGKELLRIAKNHQVLCVTHLPQVACLGQHHWVVTKNQTDEVTNVTIASIHDQRNERKQELARMLGDRASKSALQHAEELLGC